ncbi:MAG TPA: cbb3-type cytochrome c oxidase N-terminal domain-containing protein [Cryomorphaceae bacterium]|nr:cbb3-type cytochrome c oxidase N-terminal domain-containing protein [Cryomorphaceae bacterium]
MIKKKNVLMAAAVLLTSLPMVAAEPESGFSTLMQGPNLALAIIAIIQLIAILSVGGIIKRLTRNTDYFVKLKKLKDHSGAKAVILLMGFMGLASIVNAQEVAAGPQAPSFPEFLQDANTLLLLVVNIVLLMAFLYMTQLLKSTVAMLMPEVEEEPEVREVVETGKVMHALTDAVPLDREHEVMMDHEYDGIRELDNNLPPWWVWMFYATIVFAFVYLIYYHVLPYGLTQEEEYIAEVQQAEEAREAYLAAAKNLVDENNIVMLADVSDLKAGKNIFIEKCAQCHAADGGGGVGPNLTDAYWIHGGSIRNVFETVKYGVPTKGMISWESQLRPIEMAQVSSYIKTLEGTTPAAPKDPQGELWVAPDETVAPADSTGLDSPVIEEEISEEDAQTAALK